MRKSPVRPLTAFLAAFVLVLLFSACGGRQPRSVSEEIAAQDGGVVSLGDDITLRIPVGALPEDATVTITTATEDNPAPGELEGAQSVGTAFDIDLGGQELSEPVTLEIAFDADLLPEDLSEDVVFLAFYDKDAKKWIPVGGQVDQERNIVIIETDHLSWWNPFSWNWDAWIAVLKKTLSLELSQWFEAVALLTAECQQTGDHVSVDHSYAYNVLQGCIEKDDPSVSEFRVTNLRSFHFEARIFPTPDQSGYLKASLLGPGESAVFTVDASERPPDLGNPVVFADLTNDEAMWRMWVGLVARMLPAGDEIPDEGLAFVAQGLAEVAKAQEISEALDSGDADDAAEKIFKLITGDSFVEAFFKLAGQYGREHGIDMLTKWDAALYKAKLLAASVDVIITFTDFVGEYLLDGFMNLRPAVTLRWSQPTSAPAPELTPSPSPPHDPETDSRQVALDFLYAWKSMDYDKMAQLVDPAADKIGLLRGNESAECFDFGFLGKVYDCLPIAEWAAEPYEDRCLERDGEIETRLPCAEYDLTGVTDAWADCRVATPAESANGYGPRCGFGLAFGQRMGNEGPYEDAYMCILVQDRADGAPVVVRAIPSIGTLTSSGCRVYTVFSFEAGY